PNTYYLKTMELPDRLMAGTGGFGLRALYLYMWPLLLGASVLIARRAPASLRGLSAVVLWQLAYGVTVGGDSFLAPRFLAPVTPLLIAAATWALRQATERAAPLFRGALVAGAVSTFPVFAPEGVAGLPQYLPHFALGSLVSADLIRANVPRGALV